jgi:predicted RNA-binding protein with RPS1 domain
LGLYTCTIFNTPQKQVCLKRSDALEESQRPRPISASTLKPGQELFGYVKDITDYGVFIDVGANRKGLLHITRIGQRYDRFINKEEGLKQVGIKRGTPINVVVLSNEKKRLELDFPPADVDEEEEVSTVSTSTTSSAGNDISEDEEAAWAAYGSDVSADEEAMWAAYASNYSSDDDKKDNNDDYDEDRDIEDALGIGSW